MPDCSAKQDNCLIGIYHSNSWQSSKDRVLKEFKATNGAKRILIATTALCMGVNFPDVRYIINWGPARSILDQHQETGRAGREGEKSHIFVLYHGQQATHCEQEVKDFIRAKGCLRVAAYLSLDATIKPHALEPLPVLYRDFVMLLLCYIVLSYIIVVLRVHGCACAVSENEE